MEWIYHDFHACRIVIIANDGLGKQLIEAKAVEGSKERTEVDPELSRYCQAWSSTGFSSQTVAVQAFAAAVGSFRGLGGHGG